MVFFFLIIFNEQFAQREEWTTLCGILASKLMAAGNTLAATLCYICAGNIDKTLEIWSRSLQTEHDGKSYVDLVQVSFLL
jgi:protein transport protein SEC31